MAGKREPRLGNFSALLQRAGIFAMLALLALVGAGINPKFLTADNFLNIVDGVVLLGIVAVGMAFVTYSGHFADLSVPTTMAIAGVVAVEMLRFGLVAALAAGMLTGAAIGCINAVVIGRFRANPIIWTLAMSYVTKGLMRWIWMNRQIYPDVKGGGTEAGRMFAELYRAGTIGPVTLPMLVLVLCVVAGQIAMKRTAFGQQLKLVGANADMARMTGVRVPRTVGLAFVLSACAAAVAGILMTSLSKVGAYYIGEGFDFDAVTAIVLGGMTLAGGRGDIVGVLGGVLLLGVMGNLMTLLGIDTFSQRIVKGVVFIAVAGLGARALRRLGRDDA
ncbi:MAG: ABC transporter permease [Kiritimatiellae bacterium]|nr:ABC transporter permease [Kiritimatiellia bacterium]